MSSTTTYLPDEITSNILTRLPIKSILRFKSVSKAWYTLINDPIFVSFQLERATTNINDCNHQCLLTLTQNHYSIFDGYGRDAVVKFEIPFNNPNQRSMYNMISRRVIGCCNGLVCFIPKDLVFHEKSPQTLILWNPSIRQYRNMPHPSSQFKLQDIFFSSWGFGFHPKTGQYKVIRIAPLGTVTRKYKLPLSEVKVYTVGSGLWRELQKIPYHIHRIHCESHVPIESRSSQALVNGVLHWITSAFSTNEILSFDLEDEKFRKVPQPVFGEGRTRILNLGVSRRCLSMLVERRRDDLSSGHVTFIREIEIWVMEVYSLKESWTKKCTFNSNILDENFIPWKLLDNGEILYRIGERNKIRLFSPLEHGAAPRSLNNRSIQTNSIAYLTNYVESIVSPKQIENSVEEQGQESEEGSTWTTNNEYCKKLRRR